MQVGRRCINKIVQKLLFFLLKTNRHFFFVCTRTEAFPNFGMKSPFSQHAQCRAWFRYSWLNSTFCVNVNLTSHACIPLSLLYSLLSLTSGTYRFESFSGQHTDIISCKVLLASNILRIFFFFFKKIASYIYTYMIAFEIVLKNRMLHLSSSFPTDIFYAPDSNYFYLVSAIKYHFTCKRLPFIRRKRKQRENPFSFVELLCLSHLGKEQNLFRIIRSIGNRKMLNNLPFRTPFFSVSLSLWILKGFLPLSFEERVHKNFSLVKAVCSLLFFCYFVVVGSGLGFLPMPSDSGKGEKTLSCIIFRVAFLILVIFRSVSRVFQEIPLGKCIVRLPKWKCKKKKDGV